jgi:ribosomal protein L20
MDTWERDVNREKEMMQRFTDNIRTANEVTEAFRRTWIMYIQDVCRHNQQAASEFVQSRTVFHAAVQIFDRILLSAMQIPAKVDIFALTALLLAAKVFGCRHRVMSVNGIIVQLSEGKLSKAEKKEIMLTVHEYEKKILAVIYSDRRH